MEDFSAEMLEMLQLGNKSEMENFIFEKYGIDLKSKDLLPVSYTHLDVYKRQKQRVRCFYGLCELQFG